jgi:hypothetical protein
MHTITRTDSLTRQLAGAWLIDKARSQARSSGTYRAACNLRRQGVELSLALAILRAGK